MHRVQRFESWARLGLIWFAGRLIAWYGLFAPLPRGAERELHAGLDQIARVVCCMAFLRALARTPTRARANLRGADLRALFGAALRRRFARGDIASRLNALNATLADMEALAIKLARRLARGLTRHRAIRPRSAPACALCSAFAPPAPAADTS